MRGDHGHPTIMLEAVASHDLWLWHAYFGPAGSNNDTNVLHQLPIFDDVYDGIAPECPFQVNNVTYKHKNRHVKILNELLACLNNVGI